jgi:hypothetical protein
MIRPLTERQEQVVDGIRRGLEYGEIAAELGISDRTVESHVVAIMNVVPNEDDLPPYLCIFLWARHREWLLSSLEREAKADDQIAAD